MLQPRFERVTLRKQVTLLLHSVLYSFHNANYTDKDLSLPGCFTANQFTALHTEHSFNALTTYWGADKSLARPTFRCILFDG